MSNNKRNKEWSIRNLVNDDGKVERVRLVEDREEPDGILSVENYREISPPGSRPHGRLQRLPDEQIPVRIEPTGDVSSEKASLETINHIIKTWDDYGPLAGK